VKHPVLLSLATGLCLAVGMLQAQQNTVIRTETRVVLVDAIVTGKNGAYLRDLSAKDFRVWEDNKEQKLTSVSLESGKTAPTPLVLFFDETSMDVRDQIAVRQAASGFIDAATGPNRKMAVVTYNGNLRVGQNFTDNALRLKDAVPKPRASGVEKSDFGSGIPVHENTVEVAGARNMISALGNLGENLGALPGRKIVVLFTGRISSARSDASRAIEECNRSAVALYPVDVRPVVVQTRTEIDRPPLGLGRNPQGPNDGSGVGIQDSSADSQQMLSALAKGTGGFVIENSNDLPGGLQRIGAEDDAYYMLGYAPPESKEGSCHTLRVKVDRDGTAVRARSSYCTSKPQDLLAGTIAGQDLEKRAAAAELGNMTASVALPYFYTSPNVASVHVAAEIGPGAVKFEKQKGKLHAEISLLGIASAPDGGVQARFSDTLRFDLDSEAQAREWRTKPIHYEKEFRIAPGQYSFTLASDLGKATIPLVVESWTAGKLALSSIVLSREIHPAADLGLGPLTARRTPLVAAGALVIPSGSAQFRKSERGYFYFEVYAPDPGLVKAQVRVLDSATGQSKWDSGLTSLPIPANGGKPSLPASSRLPFDSLTTGSYQLEIRASDAAGNQASRTADFVVE
jgi:Ca-activated chloride channel family protein